MNRLTSHDIVSATMADYGITASQFRRNSRRESAAWTASLRQSHARRPSWTRDGLEKLVSAAVAETCNRPLGYGKRLRREDIALPYNLVGHGPWVGFSHRGHNYGPEREKMIAAAGRMAGWLRILAASPAEYATLRRLIRRCVSPRGVNSPHTTLDMWRLIERFRTPGACNRWLVKVIKRADVLLANIGIRVSWEAIARAAQEGDLRPRRASLRAAAATCLVRYGATDKRYGKYPSRVAACAVVIAHYRHCGAESLRTAALANYFDATPRLALVLGYLPISSVLMTVRRFNLYSQGDAMVYLAERTLGGNGDVVQAVYATSPHGVSRQLYSTSVWLVRITTRRVVAMDSHLTRDEVVELAQSSYREAIRYRLQMRVFRRGLSTNATEGDSLQFAAASGEPGMTGIYADWLRDQNREEEATLWDGN